MFKIIKYVLIFFKYIRKHVRVEFACHGITGPGQIVTKSYFYEKGSPRRVMGIEEGILF